MPTWNEQQYQAIHAKAKNVIVSASAGAGKTTVLIARLVDLVVHQRIGIEHILAMTFTEAAANEMKKRLAAQLYELYVQESDETEKQYISEQLTAIENAHISTIHSFCLSILQEFYYTIGLSSTMVNTIMSDSDANIAKAKAMDRVFAMQYERNDPAFAQLTMMFSARGENDDKLKEAIMTLSTNANAQSDPHAWLERICSAYQPYQSLSQLPETIFFNFMDHLAMRLTHYIKICLDIQTLYHTTYIDESKKATLMDQKCNALPPLSFMQDDFATSPLALAWQTKDYPAFREAFINICHLVIPTSPNKEDLTYQRLRKQALALEDELLEILYEERLLLSDIADLQAPIAKLIEMSQDYMRLFAQIKADMQCIDFDDMEHFALRILTSNQGAIATHYRELFTEIMVDEFQDANDVQNELVRLICRGNNVFRVGDIKQSIYGFRHAKPQLMRGLIDHAGSQDIVIYLSNNYRSKKMIVDFNNALFKELMNLQGFFGRYDAQDDVTCGIPQQEVDNVPIVFHTIDAKAIKEESERIFTNHELKASYIASQIVQIKETQHKQWKDFVVLVRANARKADLKQVFDAWNIPNFIDVSSGFYQSNAVSIILSTLHALVDPNDEISLIAALLSPLFQITIQEITDIRLAKGDDSFYAYMTKQHHAIIDQFEALRNMIHQNTICELLNALYALHHYYERHTSPQERTNLDYLYEQAITYEQDTGKDIYSFIRMINEIKDMESSEAMPIGSEDDVVRVMSIHQSKGLQFPVVFLWSSSQQSAISFRELYLCDAQLGLGMMYMDIKSRFVRPSVFRIAMEHKQDREELEEEMRILYVATTRSQEQLHIVDCIKDLRNYDDPLHASIVYERGGYTSWILHSALAHENHSIFHIKPVTHVWQEAIQPKQEETFAETLVYQEEDPIWEITTPSSTTHEIPFMPFLDPSKEGMQYGTRMHAYIEKLPKRIWTTADYQRLSPTLTSQEQIILQKLNENALFQKANAYPQVYHEMPFTVRDGQQILHGYMDFVAIGDDIIIIDFKTDTGKSETDLLQLYREQLLAYEKAMHILYPDKQVHTFIYSLKLHKEIAITAPTIVG